MTTKQLPRRRYPEGGTVPNPPFIAARRPQGAVPIGRNTRLGNPFKVSDYMTAEAAVQSYREWIWKDEQRDLRNYMFRTLSQGARLWCPGCRGESRPCHGSVIADVVRVGHEQIALRNGQAKSAY